MRQAQAVSKLVNEYMHGNFATPFQPPLDVRRLHVLGNLPKQPCGESNVALHELIGRIGNSTAALTL